MPTEPRFRPFHFKKNPPAKKEKAWERKRGEGGAPTGGRRWGVGLELLKICSRKGQQFITN
jgi:hypothetical protein